MNDVCSLSNTIGILSQGGIFIPVLEKGSLLPCSRKSLFCTTKDLQTQAEIVLCIRDQESTRLKEIYRFLLCNLEPQMSGVSRIDINMTLDEDFLLRVKVKTNIQEYFIDAFKLDALFQTDDFISCGYTPDKLQQIKIENLIDSCHRISRNDNESIDVSLPEIKSLQNANSDMIINKEILRKIKEIAIMTSQQNAL